MLISFFRATVTTRFRRSTDDVGDGNEVFLLIPIAFIIFAPLLYYFGYYLTEVPFIGFIGWPFYILGILWGAFLVLGIAFVGWIYIMVLTHMLVCTLQYFFFLRIEDKKHLVQTNNDMKVIKEIMDRIHQNKLYQLMKMPVLGLSIIVGAICCHFLAPVISKSYLWQNSNAGVDIFYPTQFLF